METTLCVTPTPSNANQFQTGHGLERQRLIHSSLEERTQAVFAALEQDDVVASALKRIKTELPTDLRYHVAEHTFEVLQHVIRLALHDGLSQEHIRRLARAAAFHDLGYVVRRQANEEIGAQFAEDCLRLHGASEEEIRDVTLAIQDTQLHRSADGTTLEQRPHSLLSQYLCDADLANFGLKTFFYKTPLVWSEMSGEEVRSFRDMVASPQRLKYLEGTLRLLEHHQWHTPAAQTLLAEGKEANERLLRGVLELWN